MKLLQKAGTLGVLLAVIGGASLLHADPDAGDPSSDATEGSKKMTVRLSPTEMLAHSSELTKSVTGDLRHVKHLQEVARKEKDVIKLTCVNDKFIALKAEANVFDVSRRELEAVVSANGDSVEVFDRVTGSANNAHKLRVEADTCVGEPELASESESGYDHPPFPDDPTVGDPFGEQTVEPPGYASPFN